MQKVKDRKIELTPEIMDHFSGLLISSCQQIRSQLNYDEEKGDLIAPYLHKDCKSTYFYKVLNEVEKTSMCLKSYQKEFISNPEVSKDKVQDASSKRILTNIYSSFIDNQSLWIRKLIEIFVDLTLFTKCNKIDYYRHYLLCKEIEFYNRIDDDFKNFYSCKNLNIEETLKRYKNVLEKIETKIDLKIAINLKKTLKNKFPLALNLSDDLQQAVLGCSYLNVFGRASSFIHANIGNNLREVVDKERAETNFKHTLFLSMLVILKADELLNFNIEKGAIKRIREILNTDSYRGGFINEISKPDIKVGDIVVAYYDLAEVKVIFEKFGNRAFKVKYISSPPVPGILEDCFPANYIDLVIKKEKVDEISKELKKILADSGETMDIAEDKLLEIRNKRLIKTFKLFSNNQIRQITGVEVKKTIQALGINSEIKKPDAV